MPASRSFDIDGHSVTLPCLVRDASAGTAMFEVDAAGAQRMVPADFTVVESSPGRCQLILALIDYRDNDLGDYLEIGVTFFVTPRGASADAAGTFIVRLPVDQRFTCLAGRAIWGFPKSVEDIGFDYSPTSLTATLHMDGELVLRVSVPRGGDDTMPDLPMVTYTVIDSAPHGTAFSQGGSGAQVLASGDGVHLELGDHPFAKELASLGLPGPALMSTWTEHMHGSFGEAVALDLD